MSTPSPSAPVTEDPPAADAPGPPPLGMLPVHVHMAPPPPDDPTPADPPIAHHQRWIKFLNWLLVAVGVGLIIASQLVPEKSRLGNLSEILLGFGLALAPGGALALIADWLVFGTLIDVLNGSTRALGNRTLSLQREIGALQGSTRQLDSSLAEKNERLGNEINELRVSTEFLKRSSDLGLEMIYPDRATALKDFVRHLRHEVERPDQSGQVFVVGSSIKGLLENVPEIVKLIEKALDKPGFKLRILLTHPRYSKYRENQEDRPTGAIEDEIFDGIRRLESCKQVDYPDNPDRDLSNTRKEDGIKLKLYKGTPTCFMIVAGEHMLINPYSYEEEAYRSFCIAVRQVDPGASGDTERTIYAQYLRAHFDKAWERNSVPYRHYWLEGPDANKAWDRGSCYGDVFVVQDAGHFYLSVNLTGPRDAPVRGMPTSIPCLEKGNQSEFIKLPQHLSIRLLSARTFTWQTLDPDDEKIGLLTLHEDRRRAKASHEIQGNLLNDYVMLGLFDVEKDEANRVMNVHRYNPPPHENLVGEQLPLFYVWLRGKPGTTQPDADSPPPLSA
jgi:hypothetical protein